MDLKFAKIRSIGNLCNPCADNDDKVSLNVNIPYYQRPYKWDDQKISDLITDFYKSEDVDYFVGSIVMVKNESEIFEVIDGQQRISTLFLMKYLKFILVRALIEQEISLKKIHAISSSFDELIETAKDIFNVDKVIIIRNLKNKIVDKLAGVNYSDPLKLDEMMKNIMKEYKDIMGLPETNISDRNIYIREYYNKCGEFLADTVLALKYSRESYNKKLKEALRSVAIVMSSASNPELWIASTVGDTVTEQYIKAIRYIYDSVRNIYAVDVQTPFEYATIMKEAMDNMLTNIKFCVVVTGNEKDAYTLFEVLNDRSLPIEDLDLIKNSFYKWYCNHYPDKEDVNKSIEKADRIWVENIFTTSTGKEQTKLISYLAAQYFTADSKLKYNDNAKYKDVIEKVYLESKKEYSGMDLINDIRVYQMMEIILEVFEFKYQKKAENVVKAEREKSKSITYRSLNLLHALKLYGVIPAITNIIVKKYMDNNPITDTDREIDIAKFKEYVEKIRDDGENEDIHFADIHNVSYDFWRFALLAKDEKRPRIIAKDFISKNNALKSDYQLKVSSKELYELYDEFSKWINAWRYGTDLSQLKVKVLFINLFASERKGNTLTFNKTGRVFKTNNIQLDHLEPDNQHSSAKEKYFKPSSGESRETYTDCLGNIMIMDGVSNNDKDNIPLQDSLKFYDDMAKNHWLVEEIHSLLEDDDCSQKVIIDEKTYRVPVEQFFIRRRARLLTYFKALLNKKIDENIVDIPNIF